MKTIPMPEMPAQKVQSYPLNSLASLIHKMASEHGFWTNDRNFAEMLMLAVSELSESLEEHRDGNPDLYFVDKRGRWQKIKDHFAGREYFPKPEGTSIELVDCLIRILDTLHSRKVDIDYLVFLKMRYNDTRPHMHGKAY